VGEDASADAPPTRQAFFPVKQQMGAL
jgi:hypothetical protein